MNKLLISSIILVSLILSLTLAAASLNVGPAKVTVLQVEEKAQPTTNIDSSDSDVDKLISYIQNVSSGRGIPISVTNQTATNWTQFYISLLLSSVMMLWLFGQMIGEGLQTSSVKGLLKQIKRRTGRNIIFIKHTSQDLFSQSMIDDKTLYKLQIAMNKFAGKPFDLLLHTPGGSIFPAMYISRLLKDYPGQIRAIVCSYSMSGGSLLALSADELWMNPGSTIGPIDPQIGSLFKFGSSKAWNHIVRFKGKKAEDSSISMAMTGAQYTKSIYDHLIATVDFGLSNKQKQEFVKFLTDGNVEHAFQLTPERLSAFGLPVKIMKDHKLIGKLLKVISKLGGEGVTFV